MNSTLAILLGAAAVIASIGFAALMVGFSRYWWGRR